MARAVRQDSLAEQLDYLKRLAIEHGLYDADDWLRGRIGTDGLSKFESHIVARFIAMNEPPSQPTARRALESAREKLERRS